ncbi:MAG: zonular occludens toxin domain-containing protein [Sulfurimonas sp.]|uniref:zonular occludens toxin domain-containing protein n=1 Tax=Sulfurimonas sp. TaxID=2022749 RepID=UPI002621BE98|nr:zonular occludens toxin domain-containing protein [Sulfurimonas sp.]MDD5400139.1 zonular occludens toxin domain-containing protein [Sulfurimonas sp.]
MITFFLGRPASGKTYYAVDKIFNNFSSSPNAKKDKKFKYEVCYTNINEFNFDIVDNVFPLDFDDLKIKLTVLHTLYKKKSTDEELIEKCIEFNILNAFFVIDEAHNFFSSRDTVLVWWLSYHRHLFHEIILITQNLALVESKYKTFSEFFYEARPASLTLDKRYFFYSVYCSSRLTKASKSGVIKIKRNVEVFDLYKSGDSINTNNVIFKILLSTFILFIVLSLGFSYYVYTLKSQNQKDNSLAVSTQIKDSNLTSVSPIQNNLNVKNQNQSSVVIQEIKPTFETTDRKLFSLFCNSKNCFNDDILLPIPLFEHFLKSHNIKLLYTDKKTSNLYKFYLDTTEEFYKYISNKKVKNDEKVISNSSFISPAASK